MSPNEFIWSHYSTQLTATEATTMFAEGCQHFAEKRKAIRLELVEGNRMAIDFDLENDRRHYRCEWDDNYGFCVRVLG